MNGNIGATTYTAQPRLNQPEERNGVQIHLGRSGYQFNQVLDLVAPAEGSNSSSKFGQLDNKGLLDTDSLEKVATLMGERKEQHVNWKQMAMAKHSLQKIAVNSAVGVARSAYKIYSNSSRELIDPSSVRGVDVISSDLVDFRR
ncbi:MAG: hypothetical protein HQL67_03455 [Magnetococcales bacterium]|nr:hypothetical protein [Magnetococcales bacterium]